MEVSTFLLLPSALQYMDVNADDSSGGDNTDSSCDTNDNDSIEW